MGLPAAWLTIFGWLTTAAASYSTPEDEPEVIIRKNPEVPILTDYASAPPVSFWQYIPFRPLPAQAQTPVDVSVFRHYVTQALPFWPFFKRIRAMKALNQLENGAQAALVNVLHTSFSPNMRSAFDHGPFITDNIVSWLKAGFVLWPLLLPPLTKLSNKPIKSS